MRTLKFRIWNTKEKCFYTDDYVKANFFNFIERMPDEPIMQFTGLLDRHGKEIYEGDIVQDEYNRKEEVAYITPRFIPFFKTEPYQTDTEWIPEEIEVIGNIYQDEHLLKNK